MSKRIALLGLRLALVAASFALAADRAYAGPGGGTYYANSPPLRKFVDTLPPLGCNSELGLPPNNLGQCIPIAKPDSVSYPGSDYYVIAVKDFTERMHSDLPKATKLRGYVQTNFGTIAGGTTLADNTVAPDAQHYLGPIIVAKRDRPVRIKFVNQVAAGAAGNLFIPVDQTLMGTNLGPNSWVWNPLTNTFDPTGVTSLYTENRAELHLHGGFSPWISDGTPHQWITPAGETGPYLRGVQVKDVPDMAPAAAGEQTYYYTNAQSARLMFYHDHALGLTRLNVYAGEAAGYLLRDDLEAAMEANGTLPALQYNLPLVIQDKTFVPADVALQDALWDTVKWGAPGDLWFPHVYETNQDPTQPGGMSATGRWDYGPWFWPPWAVTNPPLFGGQVANLPHPSTTPESFMDTPLVNGTAYPTVTLEPRRYRLRVLNACNDRTLNLQLYKADPSYTVGQPGYLSEVKMVPPPQPIPRIGGIPDPTLAGPPWINIGTEGGFLPAPDVSNDPALKQLWVGYDLDPRSITINNVKDVNLFLGPAQRADVIVDLAPFAGQTLILYNDAPAPVPANDARVDYYTGNPDMTAAGGNVSTLPGMGPNTRTVMQIKVAAVQTGTPDVETFATTLTKLSDPVAPTGLKEAFRVGQDPLVVQPSVPPYQVTNFSTETVDVAGNKIPIHKKSIQELFDPAYGRMNSLLGTELQWITNNAANTNFNYYSDLATEILPDGQTQVWMVVHNGVDTHFIHFHLVNVQVVGRVDWAGVVKAPFSDETGWRETVRMDPLEQTIVAMKPVPPPVPWAIPDSIRPIDPTKPSTGAVGSAWNGVTNPNPTYNFGWEYVWHCHLLGHEENDMMRPLVFQVAKAVPTNLTPLNPAGVIATPNPLTLSISLTWNLYQASPVAPITSVNIMDEIAFRVERQTGGLTTWDFLANVQYIHNFPSTFFPNGQPTWPAISYTDTTATPSIFYTYRVTPFNTMGNSAALTSAPVQLVPIPPATGVTITPSRPSPSPFTVPVVFQAAGVGSSNYQYRFWLSTDGGLTYTLVQDYGAGTTWTLPATAMGGTYTLKVDVRSSPVVALDASAVISHSVRTLPATGVTVTPSVPSPRIALVPVTFTAKGAGSTNYNYRFSVSVDAGATWTLVQDYSNLTDWTMPALFQQGAALVRVDVKTTLGATPNATTTLSYYVGAQPATSAVLTSSVASPQTVGTPVTFTAAGAGSTLPYDYQFWLFDGTAWTMVQAWGGGASWVMPGTTPVGVYAVSVEVRTSSTVARDVWSNTISNFVIQSAVTAPATSATLTPSLPSPQQAGTAVVWTAVGHGSTGPYDYQFWLFNGTTWTIVQTWGGGATWTVPGATGAGTYAVAVEVRTSPLVARDVWSNTVSGYVLTAPPPNVTPPATSATLIAGLASPQTVGTAVTFVAAGSGSTAPYDYQFWLFNGTTWSIAQAWGGGPAWTMPGTTPVGTYAISVEVRTSSLVARDVWSNTIQGYQIKPVPVVVTPPATGATLVPGVASPQTVGTAVNFTAACTGTTALCDYQFWLFNGTTWSLAQAWGGGSTWALPGTTPAGTYAVSAEVRTSALVTRDVWTNTVTNYVIQPVFIPPATGGTVTPSLPSPHDAGTPVNFTAACSGTTGTCDYQFWLFNGTTWSLAQAWGGGAVWTMPGSQAVGTYAISVETRTSALVTRDAWLTTLAGYVVRTPVAVPATGALLSSNLGSPQAVGTPVTFTAACTGTASPCDYQFWQFDGAIWTLAQGWGGGASWIMPGSTPAGTYAISVETRTNPAVLRDAWSNTITGFQLQ